MLEHVGLRIPAVAAGALALAVAGCGGSSYNSKSSSKPSSGGSNYSNGAGVTTQAGAGGGQTLKLKADPDGSLYFEPKALKAKAGKVTLVMTNPASTGTQHGIGVKGNGVDKDGPIVKPGGTAMVSAALKPGKYTFYCNFDAHAKKGMKGTLTIQ
jgi:uncharacterized cupredoxin-like copper-binding protein